MSFWWIEITFSKSNLSFPKNCQNIFANNLIAGKICFGKGQKTVRYYWGNFDRFGDQKYILFSKYGKLFVLAVRNIFKLPKEF